MTNEKNIKCICNKNIVEHDKLPLIDEGPHIDAYYCDIWQQGFTIAGVKRLTNRLEKRIEERLEERSKR